MKLLRYTFTTGWVLAFFAAHADEKLAEKAEAGADQTAAGELELLRGTWEGGVVGRESEEKIRITIAGKSFNFHRDTNFWFETTITLPAGKDPKQLHATIKECPPAQAESIGKVVGAIYKVEDGTLTLGDYDIASKPPPNFAEARSLYVLKKVQNKSAEPTKTK